MPLAAQSAESIVLNEISYNPPAVLGRDAELEFLEFANVGDFTVSVGGWVVKDEQDGNAFVIPAGTEIAAGDYLVLARNSSALRRVYGDGFAIVGDVGFGLSNSGDEVRVFSASGQLIDRVAYNDNSPWPESADGEGATLERIDSSAIAVDDFTNFAASSQSARPGTPGRANSSAGTIAPRHVVVINEIAYNPVREAEVDPLRHCESQEFVEIHNRGSTAVDLSGWSFTRGFEFVFDAGSEIAAGGYVVLAKDVGEFAARFPEVDPAVVHGPYTRRLDDGGEELMLVDAVGEIVDFVEYDDRLPWPINPDGIRGSLELVASTVDNDSGWSWQESEDFRGTPGGENSATRDWRANGESLAPLFDDVGHVPVLAPGAPSRTNVASGDEVLVHARVWDADGAAIERVIVEYQVLLPGSYIRLSDPAYETEWTALEMGFSLQRGRWEAVLPSADHRTVVRYRLRAQEAGASAMVRAYPRREDPEPNVGYLVYDGIPPYVASEQSEFGSPGFMHPGVEGLPTLQVIGSAEDIEALQYALHGGSTYPWKVTVVYYWVDPVDGHVESDFYDHVDARARGGVNRYRWPKRSWKLRFNKGNPVRRRFNDGSLFPGARRHLMLNGVQTESSRGDGGIYEALAWKVFRDAGVSAGIPVFTQMRVIRSANEASQFDGDFFGVYLNVERLDVSFFDRIGHVIDDESTAIYNIDGPPEKKHPDCTDSLEDVNAFIDGVENISTREWFEENLDVDRYLRFVACVDLTEHSDLSFHNFYYYHNAGTGLWEVLPWDLDNTFGNRGGQGTEPLRPRVTPQYPLEFEATKRFLLQTVYRAEVLERTIDGWAELVGDLATAERDRWNHGPDCVSSLPGFVAPQCGRYTPISSNVEELKDWIARRRVDLLADVLDPSIPRAPQNVSPLEGEVVGSEEDVELNANAYFDADGDAHAESHWLLIESNGEWSSPRWELRTSEFLESAPVRREASEDETPSGDFTPLLAVGRSYAYRVRYRDATGRWGFFSEPTQFSVGERDTTAPLTPGPLRLSASTSRGVHLVWEPSIDLEGEILHYRVLRDGAEVAQTSAQRLRYVDRTTPGIRHEYQVIAVNTAGLESPPSNSVVAQVEPSSFGGWAPPVGGFDYVYDAEPGESQYSERKLYRGALDGTWRRSLLTDFWDGSRPGEEGGLPGGVQIETVDGGSEGGGEASVLSLEDPGDPTGATFVSNTNSTLFFLREVTLRNEFVDGDGVTFLTRFRVHPSPRDVDGPLSQSPSRGKGQVGVTVYSPEVGRRRQLTCALSDGELRVANRVVAEVSETEFQSVWVTVSATRESGEHELNVYLDGSEDPSLTEILRLPRSGIESLGLERVTDVTYLELGLSNKLAAGALQVDFVAYKGGVHSPRAAGAIGDDRFLRGDANGDGLVNVTDAVRVLLELFARDKRGAVCADAADADDDGTLDVSDALLTLNYLFRRGRMPSPPHPTCGVDSSDDALQRCAVSACR